MEDGSKTGEAQARRVLIFFEAEVAGATAPGAAVDTSATGAAAGP